VTQKSNETPDRVPSSRGCVSPDDDRFASGQQGELSKTSH